MTLYKGLPVHTQADNILHVLEQATYEEIQEGLSWYSEVRAWCDELGEEYNVQRKQVAGVVAVLSPNTPWWKNLEYAENAVAHFRGVHPLRPVKGLKAYGVRTFNQSIDKAYEILACEDYSQVKGNKVRSFWDNIWNENSTEVTHDLWSARVVWGDLFRPSKYCTPLQYQTAVTAYHVATQHVQANQLVDGLDHAYQRQAIVWVTVQRLRKEAE